jgi:hypothetical protein
MTGMRNRSHTTERGVETLHDLENIARVASLVVAPIPAFSPPAYRRAH